jgi:hypothetical protein
MNSKVPKILAMLAVTFPKFELKPDTVRVYSLLLDDIPEKILEAAALQCARKLTFFPSVHEIMVEVAEIQRKQNDVPTAYEAWEDLNKGGPGKWKTVVEEDGKFYIEEREYKFLHPLVTRVAAMLGWPDDFPTDNPVADRAHYFKAYDQTLNNLVSDQMMHPDVRTLLEDRNERNKQIGHTQSIKELADRVAGQAGKSR